MKCFKTGATAHFGHGHCYAGDIYECPECGAKMMVCNAQAYESPEVLKNPDPRLTIVDMTGNN
jgi:hypothetical protein